VIKLRREAGTDKGQKAKESTQEHHGTRSPFIKSRTNNDTTKEENE
jgi:hypothetical protein